VSETLLLTARIAVGTALVVNLSVRSWFARRSRREQPNARRFRPGDVPLLIIAVAYYLSKFVFVLKPDWLALAQLQMSLASVVAGCLVLAGGLVLLVASHRALGSRFALTAEPSADGPLVTAGVYARIRHPMYLAAMIVAVGNALTGLNLVLVATACAFLATLTERAVREDRLLARVYGERWREYAARTGFFWPGRG